MQACEVSKTHAFRPSCQLQRRSTSLQMMGTTTTPDLKRGAQTRCPCLHTKDPKTHCTWRPLNGLFQSMDGSLCVFSFRIHPSEALRNTCPFMQLCLDERLSRSHGRPRGLFYLAKQLRVERIALAQHNAKSRSVAQLKHAETC